MWGISNLSEDFVGKNENFYWLLDGATPPRGELNHKHTRYFVEELDKALTKYSVSSDNTKELLFNALEEIRKVFEEKGLDKYKYLPCSTAIVVKVTDEYIEYSVLGDSTLGIRINNEVKIISDNRLENIAVDERKKVCALRFQGIDERNEQYSSIRKNLIDEERKHMNVNGGYWIASLQPIAAEHAIHGKVNISKDNNVMVIMVSDGLERLVSVFSKYKNVCEIGDDLILNGEPTIFSKLRELENNKDNFKKPIASKNDDASYLLLS